MRPSRRRDEPRQRTKHVQKKAKAKAKAAAAANAAAQRVQDTQSDSVDISSDDEESSVSNGSGGMFVREEDERPGKRMKSLDAKSAPAPSSQVSRKIVTARRKLPEYVSKARGRLLEMKMEDVKAGSPARRRRSRWIRTRDSWRHGEALLHSLYLGFDFKLSDEGLARCTTCNVDLQYMGNPKKTDMLVQHVISDAHLTLVKSAPNPVSTNGCFPGAEDLRSFVVGKMRGLGEDVEDPAAVQNRVDAHNVARMFASLGLPTSQANNSLFRQFANRTGPFAHGPIFVTRDKIDDCSGETAEYEATLVVNELRNALLASPDAPPGAPPPMVGAPFTLAYDASDVFKDGIGASVILFVDENTWQMRTRLISVHSYGGGQSAAAIGACIGDGLENAGIDRVQLACLVGDACNTQVKAMDLVASTRPTKMASGAGTKLPVVAELANGLQSKMGQWEEQAWSDEDDDEDEDEDDDEAEDEDVEDEMRMEKGVTVVSVCLAHLLYGVGGKLVPEGKLAAFLAGWTVMLGSAKRARAWKKACEKMDSPPDPLPAWYGKSRSSLSQTRWWTEYELVADLFYHRSLIAPFLKSRKGKSWEKVLGAGKALEPFKRTSEMRDLTARMCAVVAYGEEFVSIGYCLETSSFVQPLVGSLLERVRDTVESLLVEQGKDVARKYPARVISVAAELYSEVQECPASSRSALEASWRSVKNVKESIANYSIPAMVYAAGELGFALGSHTDPTRRNQWREAAYARSIARFALMDVLSPLAARKLDQDHLKGRIRSLVWALPLNSWGGGGGRQKKIHARTAIILNVEKELEAYSTLADGDDAQYPGPAGDVVAKSAWLWEWWGKNRRVLPSLAKVVARTALILPTSAVIERAFSVMNCTFDSNQNSMKQETLLFRLGAKFNETMRLKEGKEKANSCKR